MRPVAKQEVRRPSAERRDRTETTAMRRARKRIDAVDRRIVGLLNQRTRLGLEAGAAKAADGRAVRDPEREREVLLRVAAANEGPLPQADLLALYRRLMTATRRLETEARRADASDGRRGRGASSE
jgi:chorismate mutase / prephenate dehydratase